MAGLIHPEDLGSWQAWQAARHPFSRVRRAVRPAAPSTPALVLGGAEPRLLVVLESLSSSNCAAFLAPLQALDLADVAMLLPCGLGALLPEHTWETQRWAPEALPGLRAVLAPGHFSDLGHHGWRISQERGIPFLVAQHGLITPLAPPLPHAAHLLAWSEPDADFWWSGRAGSSTVVGSQLLWEAGTDRSTAPVDSRATPVYLGQLHGAELPRRDLARAARAFCLQHGATYRPHPSETDRLSRAQHRLWERRGIRIDRSGTPLREATGPVVGVFSTGVLEAAARGLPAWVDFPRPPDWLREFWERYDMRQFGTSPTPAPPRPTTEPATAIAAILRSHL